jgi:hypothetical protein
MTIRVILVLGLFFLTTRVSAQIFAQGHNINKMNVYTLNVGLEKQSNGFYLATLDFRGRRKDVNWYIKEGAVHKSFAGEEDMMEYLSKNGWVFMEKQETKSKSGQPLGDNYVFRKSMEQLSEEEKPENE